MPLLENPELRESLGRLVCGMREYMECGSARYAKKDIDQCRAILVSHADTLEQTKDRSAALALVKSTVIQLNQLNQAASHELIETDQREQICFFMTHSGALMGFNSEDEDVTEEWREW